MRIVDQRDGRTLTGYVVARDASGRVVASSSDTEADGSVALPLGPGTYEVSASAEGYGSHTVAARVPGPEIRVLLPRGGSLSIQARNGLRGTAELIQPDGQPYVRCWCNGIAAIEISGPLTLVDRISPGRYILEVLTSDDEAKQFPVTITEGQTLTVPVD